MRGTRSRVSSYAELGLRGGAGTAMAPVVRSHQKLRGASTLSISSIGMLQTNVKSLGEIISVFSPQNELPFLLLTRRRMDPAGFEPASATWTECYVPITLRALVASIRMTLNAGKGASHTSGKPVPNWEAAHRSIGQQALAPALNDEDRRLSSSFSKNRQMDSIPRFTSSGCGTSRSERAIVIGQAHHHARNLQLCLS